MMFQNGVYTGRNFLSDQRDIFDPQLELTTRFAKQLSKNDNLITYKEHAFIKVINKLWDTGIQHRK